MNARTWPGNGSLRRPNTRLRTVLGSLASRLGWRCSVGLPNQLGSTVPPLVDVATASCVDGIKTNRREKGRGEGMKSRTGEQKKKKRLGGLTRKEREEETNVAEGMDNSRQTNSASHQLGPDQRHSTVSVTPTPSSLACNDAQQWLYL